MTHLAAIRTFTAAMKYVRCQSYLCHIGLISHICVLRSTKHGVRPRSQSLPLLSCTSSGPAVLQHRHPLHDEQGSSKRQGVSRSIRRPIQVEILYNGHTLPGTHNNHVSCFKSRPCGQNMCFARRASVR
jgi:hypothetical protein